MSERFPGIFLLAAVFVIAACGLVYELIAASLSSYLLGGSITQFSIVSASFSQRWAWALPHPLCERKPH
jgi:spermidine synthase